MPEIIQKLEETLEKNVGQSAVDGAERLAAPQRPGRGRLREPAGGADRRRGAHRQRDAADPRGHPRGRGAREQLSWI